MVEYLKEIQHYDENEMLEKLQVFQHPVFLRQLENFDFSTDFL